MSSLNWALAVSKSKSDSNFRVVPFEFFTSSWPLIRFLDLRLAAVQVNKTHNTKKTEWRRKKYHCQRGSTFTFHSVSSYLALAFVSDSRGLVLESWLRSSVMVPDLNGDNGFVWVVSNDQRETTQAAVDWAASKLLTGGNVLFLNLGTLPPGALGWTDWLIALRPS